MNKQAIISVVIPTRNRPALVKRAVISALAQSFKAIEVIVVIDGPDEDTASALRQIKDERLRVVMLPENVGGSDARNAGVKAASGEWVAFLDDDDEWLPGKLEKQIECAKTINKKFPVISCKIIARTPRGDFIWPTKRPEPGQPISDYLFTRKSFFMGEGLISTTMLLAKKSLLEIVPFRSGLKKFQEADWLLRAAKVEGIFFEMVSEPLAIWHTEGKRDTISGQCMWKYSLDAFRENRALITPRAYASFIATYISGQASRQNQWNAFVPLLREMYRFGEPAAMDILLFLGMWFVPQDIRRSIRAFFKKVRGWQKI